MARALKAVAVNEDGTTAEAAPKRPLVKNFWFFFDVTDASGNIIDPATVNVNVKHVFTNSRDVGARFEELQGMSMVKHTMGDAE